MKSRPYKHLAHVESFAVSPLVFFTAATFNRRCCLAHPVAFETLRSLWERSADSNGWVVGGYLLMPDHVHLFARPRHDGDAMGTWVGMWKSVSARVLARHFGIAPPLWQDEYFDRFVRSAESYREKWEYVRANPVRAGLVGNPEDWPYQGVIHDLRL